MVQTVSADRIDGLTRTERERRVASYYGRQLIGLDQLVDLVDQAVVQKDGFSLVRVGDVVSSLLCERFRAIQIWSFLGIPNPPPPAFLRELHQAVRKADILGLTHRRPFAHWVAGYLKQESIAPPYVTESFVNDSLYAEGHLHDLLRRYRVALVGRSASEGATRLAEQGIKVAAICDLPDWKGLSMAEQQLLDGGIRWDVALVGGGLAGRLLCSRLAGAGRVALDIGHALDGFADPQTWERPDRRQRFRQAYKRKPQQKEEPG